MKPPQACDIAGELLTAIGFECVYSTDHSQSRYYSLPGLKEVIRVSDHTTSRKKRIGRNIRAKVTFLPKNAGIKADNIEHQVATALGFYLLRYHGIITYKGRRQTPHDGVPFDPGSYIINHQRISLSESSNVQAQTFAVHDPGPSEEC